MSFIGKDPEKLRSYYSDLFGWEFHTNAPVAEAISQPGNYGFVNRNTTSDRTGIPGGVGGGVGYKGYAMFYVGVPNVEAALQKARTRMPHSTRAKLWARSWVRL